MLDIEKKLATSLKNRDILHSQADFQHHLAWFIHTKLETAKLRLEYPLSKNNSNRWEYANIVLKSPLSIGIELKYKAKRFTKKINDECFELKDQGAFDVGRYGF